ncbi:unnamed protein product [Paramecium sonneborni]|uniref:Uncharacterized protein n=1 Tax=Paramecium sonneborni TaxID=65129 RepID=A0A8S1Q7D8_9CILI|nr:unnamed protein product [Paramecium sonneborni]
MIQKKDIQQKSLFNSFQKNLQIINLMLKRLIFLRIIHQLIQDGKIYLKTQLNMISTMLDSQIKLDYIAQVIKDRALASPNKKVPLHTFLCYNVSLKDYVSGFLSEQPPNYQVPYDILWRQNMMIVQILDILMESQNLLVNFINVLKDSQFEVEYCLSQRMETHKIKIFTLSFKYV